MPKVLFVATVVKTHIMQFHLPYLEMFQKAGWETAVAARNDYDDPADCVIPHCDAYYDIPFARSPLGGENRVACRMLKDVIDRGHYDIIHCHTPVGGALCRLAAREARKRGTRVIYTAHGFHFYTGAPLKNWLLYYPVEKWLARYTDTLITINHEDYARARTFGAGEVRYVPGVGVDLSRFTRETHRETTRESLGLGDAFTVLTVAELIPRKNYPAALRAVALLQERGLNVRYLICGSGVERPALEALARELGVADRVTFLGYRRDVPELCAASDVFLFPSTQEGLPVAVMEAMAAGLPVVSTAIRGSTDLIESGVNGLLCGADPASLADAVEELCRKPEMGAAFARQARLTVDKYGLPAVRQAMAEIYFPGTGADALSDRY